MKPDLARPPGAHHFQPETARLRGADRITTLGVYKTVRGEQDTHAFKRREKQSAIERRIKKNDVEGGRREAGDDHQRVAGDDLDLIRSKALFERGKVCKQAWIALYHHHAAATARRQFETKRPAAGEKIQTAQRADVGTQECEPVEERFAHSIGCRAQAGNIGHGNRSALPGSADDANPARSRPMR